MPIYFLEKTNQGWIYSRFDPMEPIHHCPNPECLFRVKHGVPATYRADTDSCNDCGSALADGKGFLDTGDFESAQPLEMLCTADGARTDALGKATGEPIVLQRPPGAVSLPTIQLAAGVAIIVVSFYYIHQEHFVALLPAVIGFVFFFLGVNRLKNRDRRVRTVRPFERGFVYQVGEKACGVHYRDIQLATPASNPLRVRAVPVGVLHQLGISFGCEVYWLASFEARGGIKPAETDRFVLWARELAVTVERRNWNKRGE